MALKDYKLELQEKDSAFEQQERYMIELKDQLNSAK